MSENNESKTPKVQLSDEELKILLEYIETVQFGSITLQVQGGRIIQIEKSEKFRLK